MKILGPLFDYSVSIRYEPTTSVFYITYTQSDDQCKLHTHTVHITPDFPLWRDIHEEFVAAKGNHYGGSTIVFNYPHNLIDKVIKYIAPEWQQMVIPKWE